MTDIFDNPEGIDEESLKYLVDAFQKATEDAVESVAEADQDIEIISLQEQALRNQIRELAEQRQHIEKIKREKRALVREAEAKLADSQRRYNTFMSEKSIRDKQAAEFDRIENLTKTATWREFAYDHQIDGAKRLAVANRAILGDKRGLGKSLTSIIWLDMVDAKKVVIVAPRDVLKNFQRELEHWAPHRNSVVMQGVTKPVRDMFLSMLPSMDEYILLINYEAWRRDDTIIEKIIEAQPDTVICDEAHNMKEGKTSAFKGVQNLIYAMNQCNICGGKPERYTNSITNRTAIRCSRCYEEPTEFDQFCSVKHVLPMTGTAIMNKPQDLFTLLHLVDRQNFDKLHHFLQDYCIQNLYTGRWNFREGGEKALMARLGSRMVSRNPKTAGVKMPPQTFIPHVLEFEGNLYPAQRKAMEQIRKYMLDMTNGQKLTMDVAIAMYTRLRQAVTWPAGIKVIDPVTKEVAYQCDVRESIIMDKAQEIIMQAIDEGDRVVAFSQFKEVLKEMENRLTSAGIPTCRYDGDTPEAQRQAIQFDFDSKNTENIEGMDKPYDPIANEKGYQYQVVLAHFKTGGTGLNLDAARQAVMIDRAWNPAGEDQAAGRINRLNTKHDSLVHTIHVQGTITTWLDKINEEKAQILEGYEGTVNFGESLLKGLRDGEFL